MTYPTKEELEKKAWYRILKVLFIITIITIFIISIVSSVEIFDDYKPDYDTKFYLTCPSGEVFEENFDFRTWSLSAKYYGGGQLTASEKRELQTNLENEAKKICGYTDWQGFKMDIEEEKEGSLIEAIKMSILTFVGILLGGFIALVVVKKSFFYILYGREK